MSTSTVATLASAYADAVRDLDAAKAHAATAVGGYLTMAQAWHDAREADPKAVTVRGLAAAIGMGTNTKEADKVLVLGEIVATLGLPTIPDDGLMVLDKALGRMGTIMGDKAKGGRQGVLDMIHEAPEGADAWDVIARLARDADKAKEAKGNRKAKTDADRLNAAREAIKAIDGATLDADGVKALKALADAVNVIVRATIAAHETAAADAA